MKTIAFIESNANAHGLRALQVAKSLGYRVVFVCTNPGFYRAFGGNAGVDPLSAADEIVTARNTYSAACIREAVGERRIDGVVAFGDYHLIPAAEYARMLGLPHGDIDALKRGRRKDLMRAWLREAGLPGPGFAVLDEITATTSPVGYPCIVKPVDDSGSVGVHRADDDAGFVRALRDVLGMAVNKRGFRLARKAVVERFLEGTEMSAEAIWTNNGWAILGLSSRRNAGPIGASEVSLTFPADVDDAVAAGIHHEVLAWLRASGLDFGGAHVEFRLGPDGPQLLEINPRLAGARLTELITVATGFDPVAYVIAQAAGDHLQLPDCPLVPARAATIEFLVAHQLGTLRSIDGLQAVRGMPFVQSAEVTVSVPREVAPLLTNHDFLGFALAVGATAHDSMRHASEAVGQFKLDIA
ncbi:MAG TPA: ATP-grasp domain-containing protein [Pinirhizobacter sp.]|uniref:ATP-grasp domain-containing protein n=1 Tax=Pinirhizobacter sp. TaxID=2950432 RepID=UPI002CEB66FF|nr:ATP-grasp domain-containing protein [Pinirhizobacter sp.]HMH66765.1 ATP-grasp domain-containing protein [Pinirhizobacter sp.]